jgi:hypothetical protein
LCGDPRIFDDLTKVPQVFRNPGGSPSLRYKTFQQPDEGRCHLLALIADPPDFVAAIV